MRAIAGELALIVVVLVAMTRFYFDIRDQQESTFDNEGLEFEAVDDALAEARRALAEIMLEDIAHDGKGAICIEVRTGEGRALVEVVAASDERLRNTGEHNSEGMDR